MKSLAIALLSILSVVAVHGESEHTHEAKELLLHVEFEND